MQHTRGRTVAGKAGMVEDVKTEDPCVPVGEQAGPIESAAA